VIVLSLRVGFVVFCSLVYSYTVVAANAFPRGCEVSGFGFQQAFVTLNDSGFQTFYLMQNRSNTSIELERVNSEESFMSPRLQSKLGPQQWAAFASDVSNTHFRCVKRQDENITTFNCRDILQICQYPRVKFAQSNMGSYWVSTNKSLQQVLNEAAAKGIYLKW
jgi:hypothetical protein